MDKKKGYKDHNKIKPGEYNTRQMMGTARAFLNAAKRCNDPPVQQLGWSHPLIVPIITNAAFACELFLKTLLKKHSSLKQGHNLLELFQSIPEETKNEIIGSNDSQEFIEELNQISCLFEEWRYIYENQLRSLNLRFLFDFAERLSYCAGKIV